MKQKKTIGSFLLMTTSFIGGMAAGLLFSPKSGEKNRVWINKKATDLSEWINHQRMKAQFKKKKELQRIRNNVQQGIRHNIPNLYRATDHIDLSENDLIDE